MLTSLLGYLAGGENAIASYCRDLKKSYPVDFRKNQTSSLPILDGVNGAKDVKMFIFFTTQNSDMYVRQITQYKIPIVGGLINTISPQAEPYVNAGQLAGILVGCISAGMLPVRSIRCARRLRAAPPPLLWTT